MAKVQISKQLVKKILKKFNKFESNEIVKILLSLKDNPHKGKKLSSISNIDIKEIKYNKFRFYFITDGHMLRFATEDELTNLIIKFVRMSDKKNQQKTINQVKEVLKSLGFERFQ